MATDAAPGTGAMETLNLPDNLVPSRFSQQIAPTGLVKAVASVMKRVKEIKKSGWNKDARYGFITNDDVMAYLQDAMSDVNLFFGQREISAKIVQKVVMVKYEFDLYHEGSPILRTVGALTGACRFEFKSGTVDDKALAKAHTSAYKNFVLKFFQIPSDENEAERTEPASDGDPDFHSDDRDPPRDQGSRYDRREGDRRDDDRRDGDRDRDDRRGDDRREEDRRGEDRRGDDRGGDDRGRNGGGGDRGGDSRRQAPPDNDPPRGRWDDGPSPGDAERSLGGERPGPAGSIDGSEDHRKRVMNFKDILIHAVDENTSYDIWRENKDLLNACSDSTFNFLKEEYRHRWGIYPPATD